MNGITTTSSYFGACQRNIILLAVNATNSVGTSGWSSVWNFTTVSQPCPGANIPGRYQEQERLKFNRTAPIIIAVLAVHTQDAKRSTNADFDLYLQKWNGISWANVASSTSSTSNENLSYNGTAGYYQWRIYSYSGSGTYEFYMVKP